MEQTVLPEKHVSVNQDEICRLLKCFGITEKYAGFHQGAYAVFLAIQDPDRLTLVTKLLYPDVAKNFRTTWCAVERNIRLMAQIAWKNDPDLLAALSNSILTDRPKTCQFISILALYFLKKNHGASRGERYPEQQDLRSHFV